MVSTPAGPRQDARPTNTLTLDAVLPLLPRLRCGACRGRIALDPPTFELGFLYCLDCGRQYNAVVERLHRPLTPAEDAAARRRGRPPRPNVDYSALCIECHVARRSQSSRRCGRCAFQRKRDLMAARQRGHRCLSCPQMIRLADTRCLPCHLAYQQKTGTYERVMAVLRAGVPMRAPRIAREIGCHPDRVRQVIKQARAAGLAIVTIRQGYRLLAPEAPAE